MNNWSYIIVISVHITKNSNVYSKIYGKGNFSEQAISGSGFYYLQSRYYDPVTHRFINADSLISQESVLGNNMFAYCLNNPVNMTDITGNMPFFVVTAVIGAVAGAIIGGVVASRNSGNIWAGIGVGAAAGGIGAGVTYVVIIYNKQGLVFQMLLQLQYKRLFHNHL